MFGKKYSTDSVRRAAEKIVLYDNEKYAFFVAFPPYESFEERFQRRQFGIRSFEKTQKKSCNLAWGLFLRFSNIILMVKETFRAVLQRCNLQSIQQRFHGELWKVHTKPSANQK